jgi:hypothetical protein
MANEEHLARLKQGVKAWNQWQAADRDIGPDLTDADLTNANLYGANLIHANLAGACLPKASIRLLFGGRYLRMWTSAPLEDSRPYSIGVLRPLVSIHSTARRAISRKHSSEGLVCPTK